MSWGLNSAAKFPRLLPDEVHVWCVPLNFNAGKAKALETFLSEDERDRACRYAFERDRIRYVKARVTLRRLLGGYLNIDPSEIRFSYGACGKPELTGRLDERLRFNLSHAGGWAAYAVSRDRDVGIDIEPLRSDVPWQELAPLVFSTNERAEFGEIPLRERAVAFLRGWTRKEAYVKGCGEGLSSSLDAFDVPLGSLEDTGSIRIRTTLGRTSGWRLYPIDLIHGFASALAVEGAPVRVTVRHWVESTITTKPATAVPFRESDSIAFSSTTGSMLGNAGLKGTELRRHSEGAWRI
jgi:4'-phosphopantetheinyl transferase